MLKTLLALTVAFTAGGAQTTGPSTANDDPPLGSVSGLVQDQSGSPLQGVEVRASPGKLEAITDASGRYEFHDLRPGRYRVLALHNLPVVKTKIVTLAAGQDLASIDFRFENLGEISGQVLDENGDPVPGVRVYLIGREYQHGRLRYTFRGSADTDDRGEYRLERVLPDVRYLVLAKRNTRTSLRPISDVPGDPELRRRILVPTYYPKSTSIDGAEFLVLRNDEVREGVDIDILRSPSYCIEGVLKAGGRPASLHFMISERGPSSGFFSGGGAYVASPRGTAGPDGMIRICDLYPGEYRITAHAPLNTGPKFFGTTAVAITNDDVGDVTVPARPHLPLSGELVWAGMPPASPVGQQVTVSLKPLSRPSTRLEVLSATSSIPGEFSFPGLLMDAYEVRVRGLAHSVYVKDITYADVSILGGTLRLGSAMRGARLRITLADDATFLQVKIVDKNGNPLTDVNAFVMPDTVRSEPELSSTLVYGHADQYGVYSSGALAPGKYRVLAMNVPLDRTPETVGRLWRTRPKAKVVELGPGTTEQVTIELTPIK